MTTSYLSPVVTILLLLAGPATAAVDECLIGQWDLDMDDMAAVLNETEVTGNVRTLGGSGVMTIAANSKVTVSMTEATIEMSMPGVGQTLISMNGDNTSSIEAMNEKFVITSDDFSLETEVRFNGELMVIPEPTEPRETLRMNGVYTCTETELMLIGEDQGFGLQAMPRRWTRN